LIGLIAIIANLHKKTLKNCIFGEFNHKTIYKMGILISILIGVLAGFLAGKIMKGGGFGFWINLLVGIVGGFLGGNILGWLGIHWGGLIGSIVTSVIGAVILLWLISLIKKK
jgi:uncharacterized membrane protein YeaQ/YmgE (transglycosylase-associated protein family)